MAQHLPHFDKSLVEHRSAKGVARRTKHEFECDTVMTQLELVFGIEDRRKLPG